MEINPIPDEAALLVRKSLIVADLHIGIEEEFRERGWHIPSLTPHLEKRLVSLIGTHRVKKLIILGDLKHSIIGSTWDFREVGRFLERMMEYTTVEMVKGNHDGGIQNCTKSMRNITVHGARGFNAGNLGLFHGHAFPSDDLWKSRILIMGHEHPIVRLVDRLGIPVHMKVWMRIRFKCSGVGPKELIVMPAFNDYLGGLAVNEPDVKFLGPMMKNGRLDLDNAKLYLLDGTFLGKRKDLI